MSLTASQLFALSRLFSSSVFRELAIKGRSPSFVRLIREASLVSQKNDETVGSFFDKAFSILRRTGQRGEYVYRAAITHNLLLKQHSLKTASMLTEFRAGTCKADVAILNGTSSVYEIKSERDSLARLANQLSNYRRVFAKVYVIAAAPHIEEIINNTSSDIGILSLKKWNRIQTIREAVPCPQSVCPSTIFDSLRLAEAHAILNNLGIEAPKVPNTQIYGAMRKIFASLDPNEIHFQMVETLKKTRDLAPLETLIKRLPESLQTAALSIHLRQVDQDRLVHAMHTPIEQAMCWS